MSKASELLEVKASYDFDSLFVDPKSEDLAKAAFLVHRLPSKEVQNSKSRVTWADIGTAILLGLSISKEDIKYLTLFIDAANGLGIKAHKEDITHLSTLTIKELKKIDPDGTLNLLNQAGISK